MADLLERVRASLAGRYTIERELGRGGMATVYLARDLKHDRPVALKVLRPELAASVGAERFVTPYVEGESLRNRLDRERQLPIAEAVHLAAAVAGALDYAHRHHIVHRDIKPENILLEEGQAVVADFGIARALQTAEGGNLTETGVTLGTATYMSPEQATADQLDGRSDIYSLGCVLYEMLAGEPPYSGPTAQAIIAKRFSEPIPHVRTLRETVSEPLAQALQKALAKAPVDRFATAAEMASALAGVSASRDAPSRRSWRVPAVAAGIVMIGVAAWMISHRRSSPGIPGNTLAVLPFRVAGPDSGVWREGLVDLLSINLDGAPGVRVIAPRTVLSRWNADVGRRADVADQDAALGVARAVGARFALTGSLVGGNRSVRLSAAIRDLQRGTDLGTEQVEGSADSVPALVDRLTVLLLRAGLGRDSAALPAFDLARPTTTSLVALKAFLAGERFFRRAQPREAEAEFKRAVAADSTFALAWYRLSAATGWTHSPHLPESTAFDSAALRFAERLPVREALTLQASAAINDWRPDAIRLLQDLVARYPEDAEAWYLLGDAYFHLGHLSFLPLDSMVQPLQRAIALDSSFSPAYLHLVEYAFRQGDSATARALIDRLRRMTPESPKTVGLTLAYALSWGTARERTAAEAVLDTAETLALLTAKHAVNWAPELADPTLRAARALVGQKRHPAADRGSAYSGITVVYANKGWIGRADAVWDSAIALLGWPPQWKDGFTVLGDLQGYPHSGVERAAAALSVRSRLWPWERTAFGVYAASRGRWGDFQRAVAGLEAVRAGPKKECATGLARALRHFAAAKRAGDPREAEAAFRQADVAVGTSGCYSGDRLIAEDLIRYQALRASFSAGHLDAASRWVRGMSSGSGWPTAAPLEFWSGRIAEARGDRTEARLHYERFVRWWADCDPELRPWWEEGRAALARLTAGPR
ncbi:MAG: hypothetical protein DMD55_16210 [Gemmatimonadetes bacterium]|nr:MAG: hypothetical protein DMD55_16210 [Gemmatimonadota bacterium]